MKTKTLWPGASTIVILSVAACSACFPQVVVRVVGEGAAPVAEGAEVTIYSQTGGDRTDISGSNGVARFADVEGGSYSILVRAPGYRDGYGLVDASAEKGQATVTIELQPEHPGDAYAGGMVLATKARKEFDEGVGAMRRHRYDQAQKYLDAAYKLAPGNTEVNDKLGELYLINGNFNQAQRYLETAFSLDRSNESVLTDLGELRIGQGDYGTAQELLENAVARDSRNWFAHWMLASAYLQLNDNEEARAQAAAAIKSGKGKADDARYILGEALARLGCSDEAIRVLQSFIKASPQNSYVLSAYDLIEQLQAETLASGVGHSTPRGQNSQVSQSTSTVRNQ